VQGHVLGGILAASKEMSLTAALVLKSVPGNTQQTGVAIAQSHNKSVMVLSDRKERPDKKRVVENARNCVCVCVGGGGGVFYTYLLAERLLGPRAVRLLQGPTL